MLFEVAHRTRRERDPSPTMLGLWFLEPQTGLGLLKRPLDADGCTINIAPSQGQEFTEPTSAVVSPSEIIDLSCEPVSASLTAFNWFGVNISTSLAFSRGGVAASATLRDSISSFTACLSAPHSTR